MESGALSWRVQFRRATLVDDGFSQAESWADYGAVQWAQKRDISDGERWQAASVDASITTRFRFGWSPFIAGITPRDRMVCDGVTYDIAGIKEIGRRSGVEITAQADQ